MERYKQSNLRYLWTLVNIGCVKSEKKVENSIYRRQFIFKKSLYIQVRIAPVEKLQGNTSKLPVDTKSRYLPNIQLFDIKVSH